MKFFANFISNNMKTEHKYQVTTTWTDKNRNGTTDIAAYSRSHTATIENKPPLQLTTDNAKFGDKSILNPEDLLLTALSSCHMLSYLYLCAQAGIVVVGYTDNATGLMIENSRGGGSFTEVVLRPEVIIAADSNVLQANAMHHKAHEICYIANSVNFDVKIEPTCKTM
jgi:organic hydroperoxide reductase OsmC/OhrA